MYLKVAREKHWFHFDVKNHLVLLREAGVDTSELQRRYEALHDEIPRDQRKGNEQWMQLEQDVIDLDEAVEPKPPCDLEGIRASRPAARVDRYGISLAEDVLIDKINAGWLGCVIGCTLGKPVESFLAEENSPPRLKQYLQQGGQWPLTGYIREASVVPYWTYLKEKKGTPGWFNDTGAWAALAEHLQYAPSDDDIQYTGIALRKMQERGRHFDAYVTLAYLNWGTGGHHMKEVIRRNLAAGMAFPRASRFMNTTREWLTPQIRVNLYGLVCPGAPEAAAELAYHDAVATHSENGIYGAMFMAAAIAAAFVEDDPRALIQRGLEQIPADCRLAREIRNTLDAVDRNGNDVEKTLEETYQRMQHYFCISLVNNCCLIVAALAHAGRDFTKAIGYTVMAGLDTDCNGTNAGTIAGVMLGRAAIDARWTEPLHDTVELNLPHCKRTTISDLAGQTFQVLKNHPLSAL